jgi:hypothetical protein
LRHTATARPAPVGIEVLATMLLRIFSTGPLGANTPAVENGTPLLVPAM